MCVCLFARISPEPHARFLPIFCACCLWPWLEVFFRQSEKSQGEWAIFRVFFPTDNKLYSIAFGTHTKTAESIEIPFGTTSGFGPRNTVLRGGDDSPREEAILGENVPDEPNTPMNCELDWTMQRRAHDRGRRLIASVGRVYYRPRRGWDCTPRLPCYRCHNVIVTS